MIKIKRIITAILAVMICLVFLPAETQAYPGGLLNGKTMSLNHLTNSMDIVRGTTTAVTDDNISTYLSLPTRLNEGNSNRAFYEFDDLVVIDGFYIYFTTNGRNVDIVYYDENKTDLYTRRLNSGEHMISHNPVSGVKYVAFIHRGGAYHAGIAEFDVFEYIDLIPPAVPKNLQVEEAPGLGAYLTWDAVNDEDLRGYLIYANDELFTPLPISDNHYTATGLTQGMSYKFTVAAIDYSGNMSDQSEPVYFIAQDVTPPDPPAGLAATGENGQAVLTWDPNNEPDLAGYTVYMGEMQLNSSLIQDTTYTITGLRDGSSYTFSVTATDYAGNESNKSTVTVRIIDTIPPAAPTGLIGAAGDKSATLYWTANTETDLDGYFIYQDGERINNVPLKAITRRITGLINGNSYSFAISAVDTSGNESPRSAVVQVTPEEIPYIPPPAAPTGLIGKGGNTTASLSWDENQDTGIGYFVYMDGQRVNFTPITDAHLIVHNLQAGDYRFQVTSVNQNGLESPRSAAITVTVYDDIPPAAPVGLTAKPGNGGVFLAWDPNVEPDLDGYFVYMDGQRVNEQPIKGTSYRVPHLINGETYTFTITAVDKSGNESAHSGMVSATPDESILDYGNITNPAGAKDAFITGISFLSLFNDYILVGLGIIVATILTLVLFWIFNKSKKATNQRKVRAAGSRRSDRGQMEKIREEKIKDYESKLERIRTERKGYFDSVKNTRDFGSKEYDRVMANYKRRITRYSNLIEKERQPRTQREATAQRSSRQPRSGRTGRA